MASTYSKNYNIELITTGERAGTWGSATNVNLGRMEAISSGIFKINISTSYPHSSPYSLSATEASAPDASSGVIPEASGGRAKVLIFHGTWDADKYVQVNESGADRFYLVRNEGSANDLYFNGPNDSVTATSGVKVPSGQCAFVYILDGFVSNAFDGLTDLQGTVTLADGTSFIITDNQTDATDFKVTSTGFGGANPFLAVDTESVVTVTAAGHVRANGDYVTISGQVTSEFGFVPANINNIPFRISDANIGAGTYKIDLVEDATSGGAFGDTGLIFSYEAFYLEFDTSNETVKLSKDLDLSSKPTTFKLKANEDDALQITDGSNSVLTVRTTTSDNRIMVGTGSAVGNISSKGTHDLFLNDNVTITPVDVGGVVVGVTSATITGISKATSAIVTVATTALPWAVGQKVSIAGVVEMSEINGGPYTITSRTNGTALTLDVDSSDFTLWESGGIISLSGYVNFDSVSGGDADAGYGVRSSGGVVETKSLGESWQRPLSQYFESDAIIPATSATGTILHGFTTIPKIVFSFV
ncbi:MAG TPA: hypothetical protein EYO58_08475, partial [Flavobacteriales bacterium]|nr:hypothetical protein [Flavobacteriales bacterium]